MYLHANVYICKYIYIHINIYINIYIYMCTYLHIYISIYIHLYTYIYITYMCMFMHVNIYIYIYIYSVCSFTWCILEVYSPTYVICIWTRKCNRSVCVYLWMSVPMVWWTFICMGSHIHMSREASIHVYTWQVSPGLSGIKTLLSVHHFGPNQTAKRLQPSPKWRSRFFSPSARPDSQRSCASASDLPAEHKKNLISPKPDVKYDDVDVSQKYVKPLKNSWSNY